MSIEMMAHNIFTAIQQIQWASILIEIDNNNEENYMDIIMNNTEKLEIISFEIIEKINKSPFEEISKALYKELELIRNIDFTAKVSRGDELKFKDLGDRFVEEMKEIMKRIKRIGKKPFNQSSEKKEMKY